TVVGRVVVLFLQPYVAYAIEFFNPVVIRLFHDCFEGSGIASLPIAQQSVQEVATIFEMPVKTAPRHLEVTGQFIYLHAVDSPGDERGARRSDPVFSTQA